MTPMAPWICGLLLATSAMALSATGVARAEDRALAAAFDGTYEHAGDEAEAQARLDAIERSIAGLPKVFQGIGRKRLSAAAGVAQTYVFAAEGEELTISADGVARTTRLDGTPVDIGGGATLTRTLSGREIHSAASREDGGASYHFTVAADGRTLTVDITIDNPNLDVPCSFTATYRKR